MQQNGKSKAPTIVMWSWMREVLELTGTELLLFSYIFAQTFDKVHKCWTCLADMEVWFGITRQTISRNIDKLVEKNFIKKICKADDNKFFIKHNCYFANIDYITELCENSDYDHYQNFLDSYRNILKQKFPEDGKQIDEYLNELSSWHQNKDIKVCITLNELAKLLSSNNETGNNISEMLDIIHKEKKEKRTAEKEYIIKESSNNIEQPDPVLFEKPKKKRTSKKAQREEWYLTKKEMSSSFVMLNAGGDSELQMLLDNFLDTDNGRSYTPIQWEQQLDNLYRYGRTVPRMIEGVRNSFMNNYRALYIPDRNEVDIELKLAEINTYVRDEGEDNTELKKYLEAYVVETPKGKSATLNQFKLKLADLSRICPKTEQKVESVKFSYMNSYASLAYTSTAVQTAKSTEIDMKEKTRAIQNFIASGYYYLKPDIQKYLTMYIEETENGKSMSASAFELALDNFRLFCLDDDDKITKLKLAIQNNYNKLATEDFAETNKLKARHETREEEAYERDKRRYSAVKQEQRIHPNNELVKGVDTSKFIRRS